MRAQKPVTKKQALECATARVKMGWGKQVVVKARPGELAKGYYTESYVDIPLVPPDQIVMIVND